MGAESFLLKELAKHRYGILVNAIPVLAKIIAL